MSKFLWFLGGCAAGVAAAAAAEVLSESGAFSAERDDSSPAGEENSAPITVADAANEDQDAAGAPASLIV